MNVALHMAEEGNMSLYSITSVNILQMKPHHRQCKISIIEVNPFYKSRYVIMILYDKFLLTVYAYE